MSVPHPSLAPEVVLSAYCEGYFPMDEVGQQGPVSFQAFDPRALMPIEGFRIPRSVARGLRQQPYEIRVNGDFPATVAGCAEDRSGVWLTDRLAAAYVELHRRGWAHSVESWREGRLCGGLFGVALGGLFTSESMFHRAPEAGNAALVATAHLLRRSGHRLWDIQMTSAHTERFGAETMPLHDYMALLPAVLRLRCSFPPTPQPQTT